MGNSQSISLLSYGILEEFSSKSFKEAYPSFSNDPLAQAYLNEVDIPINPDDRTYIYLRLFQEMGYSAVRTFVKASR